MAADSAFYNAGQIVEFPKCHPNTRLAILDRLRKWIRSDPDADPETSVLWLYGAAGAGKSSIARTIAEWCDKENRLLASFFFFRGDSSRDNVKNFIPTLAYNITQTIPGSRSNITQVIQSDPLISSKSLETQFNRLILEPFMQHKSYLLSKGPNTDVTDLMLVDPRPTLTLPNVVIIDGLDECVDQAEQVAIIRLFASVLNENLGWKIFIASRPEQNIRISFNRTIPQHLSTCIALNDEQDSDGDIRRYLQDEFMEIKQTHSYIPINWPDVDDIAKLVCRASGQFIYAKTVIKYVASNNHRPTQRLRSILDNKPHANNPANFPFAALDELYSYVLRAAGERLGDLETITQIAALCCRTDLRLYGLVGNGEAPTTVFANILNLDTEGVTLILDGLSSIILHSDQSARVYHTSFAEFLFDWSRSGDLWVDEKVLLTKVVCYILSTPRRFIKSRHIWLCLSNALHSAEVTPGLSQSLSSWDIVPALEALCPAGSNNYHFLFCAEVLMALEQLALHGDGSDLEGTFLRLFSTYDTWLSRRLHEYCRKSFLLRGQVACLAADPPTGVGSLLELRPIQRHSLKSLDTAGMLLVLVQQDWLSLFDGGLLLHTQTCVLNGQTQAAGVWFCVHLLIQSLSSDRRILFFDHRDQRKLRPWLRRKRLQHKGNVDYTWFPFQKRLRPLVQDRDVVWSTRKNLESVLHILPQLLAHTPASPRVIFALRIVASLTRRCRNEESYPHWQQFQESIIQYLVDEAGLKRRKGLGFGFVRASNIYPIRQTIHRSSHTKFRPRRM